MTTKQKQDAIAFARLTKIDEKNRLIYGRAAQEVTDSVGEIFDYAESKPYFEAWSKGQLEGSMGKSAGNIRAMHKDIAAGILIPNTGMVFNDAERAIDICAHISDDQEWAKAVGGTYTGFSIGGRYAKKWEDKEAKRTRYAGDPSEISLVDRPAIPTATFFHFQKSDGTIEERKFQSPDMALVAGDKDLDIMVKADKLPEPGAEFDHDGQTYLLHKIEDNRAIVEVVYSVTGTPEELGAFAKLMADKGMTISQATVILGKAEKPVADTAADLEAFPLPKQTDILGKAIQMAHDIDKTVTPDSFSKMEEAVRNEWITKAEKVLGDERDALIKTSKPVAVVEEPLRKSFGHSVFADETNRRYPIDTAAQVKAALTYFGMAKHSDEERTVIGTKINAAAEKHGITKEDAAKMVGTFQRTLDATALTLAKAAGVEAPTQEHVNAATVAVQKIMRKGLSTCASFAYSIDGLCRIAESCEMEAAAEGDGSDICNRIYAHVAELGECLKEMVDEEIREAVDGDEKSPAEVMAMAAALDGLKKRMALLLKGMKGGQLQKLHDRTVTMGAACANHGGPLDTAAALAVKAEAVAALKKLNPALTDEGIEAMLKVATPAPINTSTEVVALRKTVGDMTERLAKLEKQPMPMKIHLRAVSKADDGGSAAGEDPAMAKVTAIASQIEPVRKSDGTVDEVATATKIMQKLGGTRINVTGR